MIADRVRTDAYVKAVARAVHPGDVVVDLGCGPGWMTLVACRAGAKRVYAMEMNESIAYAKQLVTANGFNDRVTFLHGPSQQAQLQEPVDVMVSDIRGILPLASDGIAAINDLRQRFLAANGRVIPARDTLFAAPVSLPEFYSELVRPWRSEPGGASLAALLPSVLNTLYGAQIKADSLVSEPQAWHSIDYQSGRASGAANVRLAFRASRDAEMHGIGLWFDTVLYEDIGYSSGPGGATIYGQCLLPLLEPAALKPGQEIEIALQTQLVGGKYLWCWNTGFEDPGSGKKKRYNQSTFQGAAFSREMLRRRELGYVPSANGPAQASAWILLAMDGTRTMEAIAAEAARRFPEVFTDAARALECAVELAERFNL